MRHPASLLALIALCAVPVRAASTADSSASGTTQNTDPVVLSIFQVSGENDEGYRSTQTVSGSRTLAELRDTPNSISVLNHELLNDLIATQVADAMYFSVTGEIDTNSESANEGFVFRGILANLRLRNGVTWYGGVSDSYNIERVELLRSAGVPLWRRDGGWFDQPVDEAGVIPRFPEGKCDCRLPQSISR